MASKYLQKYPVPAGFQEILADFTREVLRDQPTNIIEYASKYFEMLEKGEKFQFNSKFNVSKDDKKYELSYNPKNAQEITKKASNIAVKVEDRPRAPEPQPAAVSTKQVEESKRKVSAHVAQAPAADPASTLPPELVQQLNNIFDSLDANGNGFIEAKQIRSAIQAVSLQLGLTQAVNEADVQQFIELMDASRDGRVSRGQFLDFHAKILGAFTEAAGVAGTEKTVNQQQVQNYMSSQGSQMLNEELRQKIDALFNELDLDGSGFLSASEIERAVNMFSMSTEGVRVDPDEISRFVEAVDSNRNGRVQRKQLYEFLLALVPV